ncbi:MAG: site-specific DNA-methyltransferase [Elusimicrobia bacterium]|nr:site-specific DNA-methyltransferase [Elusimicrobiota bacterium]
MSHYQISKKLKIFNKSCYGLVDLKPNSIEALISDPPYGISYQNNYWDKDLPNKQIWKDCLRALKPGGFGAVFSSVRLMHRLMVDLEDSDFVIKDIMFWAQLNGMPKSRDLSLDIDKELGVQSNKVGTYKYVQGYKKNGAKSYKNRYAKDKLGPSSKLGMMYKGCGLGVKPAYEPIILIQKPIEKNISVAQNIIKYGTGALNIEQTRVPYDQGETKVGHNPHPNGRVAPNILRTEKFNDGFDKFFLIPKVRQYAEDFNVHPTLKPVKLMHHLVKLLTWENQAVLDPFMGSASTGISCLILKRFFYGYELDNDYYKIARKRINNIIQELSIPTLF